MYQIETLQTNYSTLNTLNLRSKPHNRYVRVKFDIKINYLVLLFPFLNWVQHYNYITDHSLNLKPKTGFLISLVSNIMRQNY